MAKAPLAKLIVRRDKEISNDDQGWVKSRWHFSFDHYYDPKWMGVGFLRVFNHDWLAPGKAWPLHPHQDVEGISYIPAGEFEHADSLGNGGVLKKHGVQRMTLGSGALHSERNHSKTKPVEFIQMWIMPDTSGLKPEVEQKQFTEAQLRNRLFRFLKPMGEKGEGVSVHQDARMHAGVLGKGKALTYEVRKDCVGYFYVIRGAVTLNGERLGKGDAASVGPGRLELRAEAESEVLLVDTVKAD